MQVEKRKNGGNLNLESAITKLQAMSKEPPDAIILLISRLADAEGVTANDYRPPMNNKRR